MDSITRVICPPAASLDARVRGDLRTLSRFIELYCSHKHQDVERETVRLENHDVDGISGHAIRLCPKCQALLTHAFVKRSRCPMDPKPACKHCPAHCYHPRYRAAIRDVMRFSGRRMVLGGRLDYLIRLLF